MDTDEVKHIFHTPPTLMFSKGQPLTWLQPLKNNNGTVVQAFCWIDDHGITKGLPIEAIPQLVSVLEALEGMNVYDNDISFLDAEIALENIVMEDV